MIHLYNILKQQATEKRKKGNIEKKIHWLLFWWQIL